MKHAKHLEKKFSSIGRKMGMKVHVMISDGTEPIGNGIGPALEARDALWILKRDAKRPIDLEKKSVLVMQQ